MTELLIVHQDAIGIGAGFGLAAALLCIINGVFDARADDECCDDLSQYGADEGGRDGLHASGDI